MIDADEDAPKCDAPQFRPGHYYRTKAEAERLVLGADQSNLATVSLRLCLTYGERDTSLLPALMEAYHEKNTNVQLGNNTAPYDFVYAGNAAKAHILAAKALLNPDRARGKVRGEAFMITDGKPLRFWDSAHTIWRAAGDKTRYEEVTVIPAWIAMILAHLTEWFCWIFTFGRVVPTKFNANAVIHATQQYTYKIDKARKSLGYDPIPDFEGCLQRAVADFLRESGEKPKDK